MTNKGFFVWLFSSLTFIAVIHLAEAVSVVIFKGEIQLLQIYPIINEKLKDISPANYLWISGTASFVLWGITCAIAFENPIERFLNHILSDARRQTNTEGQTLEDKSELLDLMYETIESDNETLSQVKDLIYNVRADVREIEPLKESMEKLRTELSSVKKELKRLEEKINSPKLCPACGKPLMSEFKICPYCGENVKLSARDAISVETYV